MTLSISLQFWRAQMSAVLHRLNQFWDLTTKGKLGLRKKSKMPERIDPGKNERLNETTIRDGKHEKRERLRFKIKVRWHLWPETQETSRN